MNRRNFINNTIITATSLSILGENNKIWQSILNPSVYSLKFFKDGKEIFSNKTRDEFNFCKKKNIDENLNLIPVDYVIIKDFRDGYEEKLVSEPDGLIEESLFFNKNDLTKIFIVSSDYYQLYLIS